MKPWPKDRPIMSKLDRFCRANDIETRELAEASGVSRQHTLRARKSEADVRIGYARKFAKGASHLLQRKVRVSELFDLDFEFNVAGSAEGKAAKPL